MVGGVALLEGPVLVAEYTLNVAATHSERLLGAIDRLLSDAGWTPRSLDGIACAVGPGSFTGLRIGVSTAKGLAFALGVPVVGVPTLDAMAESVPLPAFPVCPALDAKKEEIYTALYDPAPAGVRRRTDWMVIRPAAFLETVEGPVIFLGSGAQLYRELICRRLGSRAHFVPAHFRSPSAASVAELGRRALEGGQRQDPEALTPLYIRPSEAELKRRERERAIHSC